MAVRLKAPSSPSTTRTYSRELEGMTRRRLSYRGRERARSNLEGTALSGFAGGSAGTLLVGGPGPVAKSGFVIRGQARVFMLEQIIPGGMSSESTSFHISLILAACSRGVYWFQVVKFIL